MIAAVLCAVAAAIVYYLGVHTDWGRRADNAAFEGRLTASLDARQDANEMLRLITRPSLALLGGVVMLVAFWRGRWRLALAAGAVIAGAVLTSDFLKALLGRPDVGSSDPIAFNSWPSGHVTIAASLSLALVMVLPRSVRVYTVVAGCVFTATFGVAVVLSGWHRPVDAIGGYLVGLGWAAAVTAVLVAWRGSGTAEHDVARQRRLPLLVGAIVALVAFGAFMVVLLISRADEISTVESSEALLVALVPVAVLGAVAVASYAMLISGAVLDPPEDWSEAAVDFDSADD